MISKNICGTLNLHSRGYIYFGISNATNIQIQDGESALIEIYSTSDNLDVPNNIDMLKFRNNLVVVFLFCFAELCLIAVLALQCYISCSSFIRRSLGDQVILYIKRLVRIPLGQILVLKRLQFVR